MFAIFFDIIIIIGLLVPLVLIFLLCRHLWYTETSWWQKHEMFGVVVLLVLIGIFKIISWGSFVEPEFIVTKTYSIHLGLTKPVHIAVLSDIQVGPYKREYFMQKTVQTLERMKPDIILYPGDFTMNNEGDTREVYLLAPLASVAAHIPFLGVMGNHEYSYSDYGRFWYFDLHRHDTDVLRSYGIDILDNSERLITVRGETVRIVGLNDLWADNGEVVTVQPSPYPTIVFAHNPDVVYHLDSSSTPFVIAAHTHGGQIRLPFIGPVGNANTVLPRALYKGASLVNNIYLYVTSGMGESGPRARLFNIPEIVDIEVN